MADQDLSAVEQRADLGNTGAVKEGDGLEAGQAAFVEQGEEKGLDGVIVVMAQGDLGDPHILDGVVQSAPAHLGAHGTGVFLLAQIEDHVVDLTIYNGIGDVDLLAVFGHGREIHALPAVSMTHIQGNGDHLKGDGIELAQLGQSGEQHEGVLAAGHAHGDGVAGLDHIVVFHTAAGKGENLVHGAS